MTRTMIGFAATIASVIVAFSASPAAAEDEMSKVLKDLKSAISRMDAAERSLSAYMAKTSRAVEDVDELKVRVRALEDEVRDLRLQPRRPSTSLRIDTSESAVTRLGRVKLINDYPEVMSVVLNGLSYRLFPREVRVVEVPPGTFTYRVLNYQQQTQQRVIGPDEEKYIQIYPRLQ
jgi:hypothetical protein